MKVKYLWLDNDGLEKNSFWWQRNLLIIPFRRWDFGRAAMAHAFNPSAQEAETENSVSSWPAWPTGASLRTGSKNYRETLSQKTRNKAKQKKKSGTLSLLTVLFPAMYKSQSQGSGFPCPSGVLVTLRILLNLRNLGKHSREGFPRTAIVIVDCVLSEI